MSRIARVVIPHLAHHATSRGNRRQQIFFCDDDYRMYEQLMFEVCARENVEVAAWCLMPNHVHQILIPPDKESMSRAVGEINRRYTAYLNARHGWSGHVFQQRFFSCPLDPEHAHRAKRYVEHNPVRAGLVERPEDWPWSSARSRATVDPDLTEVHDTQVGEATEPPPDDETIRRIRIHSRTGRPLGSKEWVEGLEATTGLRLAPLKRGKKKTPPIPRLPEIDAT